MYSLWTRMRQILGSARDRVFGFRSRSHGQPIPALKTLYSYPRNPSKPPQQAHCDHHNAQRADGITACTSKKCDPIPRTECLSEAVQYRESSLHKPPYTRRQGVVTE